MKKLFSLVLVFSLVVTLVGCKNDDDDNEISDLSTIGYQWEDTSAPIVSEKGLIEFEILSPKNALADDYNDMLVLNNLHDSTNVDINWKNVSAASYSASKSLIMADKKNLPDAIYHAGFSEQEIILYSSRKQIIALDDYLQYMPNFSNILEERPDIYELLKSADGKIYSLPRIEEMDLLPYPNLLFLNKEWTSSLIQSGDVDFLSESDLVDGLSLTTAEFQTVLEGFRDNDMNENGNSTDELPLSFVYQNWQGNQSDLYGAFGVPENIDHLTVLNDTVTHTATMDRWMEATNYYHKWVDDGLIDMEVFSQSQDAFLAKGKAADQKLGAFYWWESETVVTNPEDYIILSPLTGPYGDQYIGVANTPEISKGNFVVLSNCDNPEVLLTYIDRFYDPVISAQINYGPIGIVYEEELDENGMLVQKPIPDGMTADELRLKNAPLGLIYLGEYHWNNVVNMEPRAKLRLERLAVVSVPYVYPGAEPLPLLSYTLEEINALSRIEQNLGDYVYQKQTEWLKDGGLTQAAFNDYKATLEQIGLSEALSIYQDAYNRINNEE
jgi:putative aldouronate transport system substrate-binding protein